MPRLFHASLDRQLVHRWTIVAMSNLPSFSSNIEDVAYMNYATKLAMIASATAMYYDHLVSLEQEVEFIWKKEWSIIKFAFLWHRYLGLIGATLELVKTIGKKMLSDAFCNFWFRWETWGYSSIVFTTEVVLALWIYVIYNKNHRILAAIGAVLLAQIVAVVTILVKSFSTLHAIVIPVLDECALTDAPGLFKTAWVPILAYNIVILALFLYRGMYVLSLSRKQVGRRSSILANLFVFSLAYFLAIFASYLVCATMWLAAPLGLSEIPVAFVLALSIVASTRLLLNIRHAYYTQILPASPRHFVIASGEAVQSATQAFDEPHDFIEMEEDGRKTRSSRRTTIYADDVDREQWAIQLREIRWAGFD